MIQAKTRLEPIARRCPLVTLVPSLPGFQLPKGKLMNIPGQSPPTLNRIVQDDDQGMAENSLSRATDECLAKNGQSVTERFG